VKVLLLVLLIAIAIYLTVRLIQRRGEISPTRRPLGPDDDPDFLRKLGRRKRPDDDR
jgi:hypothetical protein